MSFLKRIGNALSRFMYGRNGADQLGLTTIWAAILLDVVNIFIKQQTVHLAVSFLSTVLLVILLFAYLIYRGFRVARYAPDKFGSLLATGITAKLAIQTLMNLFVVTGIMPVTGAALPFFSYGGTALLLQLGEMGILLNISRYMRIDGRNQD